MSVVFYTVKIVYFVYLWLVAHPTVSVTWILGVCAHTRTCVRGHVHVCMHACMYACMHVWMHCVCVCVLPMNVILVYQVSASCNWYPDMNDVTAFHIYSFIFLKKFTFFHEISCLLHWSEVCGLWSGFLWHSISGIYANSFWVSLCTFNKSWDSSVSVVTRMWAEPENWG